MINRRLVAPKHGEEMKRLALVLLCLAVHATQAQYVYWVETSFGHARVGRAGLDGSSPLYFTPGSESLPEGIAWTGGNAPVFWSELAFSGAHIRSIQPDFSSPTQLLSGASSCRGVTIDTAAGKIYWATSNLSEGATLRRASLSGTDAETLMTLSPGSNPRGVALDPAAGMVYWADYTRGNIYRAAMSPGAVPQAVVTGLAGPAGIDIDHAANRIFWAESKSGRIRSASLSGSDTTTVLSGLAVPNYLSLNEEAGLLYWTELQIPRIRRATMSGQDMVTLPLAVSFPGGIVARGIPTSVAEEPDGLPHLFTLSQNYPNPFNPATRIEFSVASAGRAQLDVFNILGERVARLYDDIALPGQTYVVAFGSDSHAGLASGVYLYRLTNAEGSIIRQMLFLK